MQLTEYQSFTPPICVETKTNHYNQVKKSFILLAFAILLFMSSCRKKTICGVTADGTPFDLIEQLTYNPNSTTFPTDYLIAFTDTTFIYCIDDDGYERTITCVTDPVTHKIIKVF